MSISRKLLLTGLLVALMLVTPMATVWARWSWCYTDPTVRLSGGDITHVYVCSPTEYSSRLVYLDIHAPKGSVLVGNGAGPIPLSIAFADDAPSDTLTATGTPSAMYQVGVSASYRGQTVAEAVSKKPGDPASIRTRIRK